MLRLLMTLTIAILGVASVVAGGPGTGGPVDLDTPGALEALRKENPGHYEIICKIVAGLPRKTKSEIPLWVRKNFKVTNVSYANVDKTSILLTSDPPKLRLFFTLDDQNYRTLMTLTNTKTDVIPASKKFHLLKDRRSEPIK